jgi:hypothetical protein
MERQSNKHSPRIDDAMEHEVESLTRGAPVESRSDPAREMEGAAEDEPTPESVIEHAELSNSRAGALSTADVRRRSELAQHLRPSIFPATRDDVVECARSEEAPTQLLEDLEQLPARVYQTTEAVWEAMGGSHEARESQPVGMTNLNSGGHTTREASPSPVRFPFRFDRLHRVLGLPFGITPGNAYVDVDPVASRLVARFGPWRVATALSNNAHVTVTGPYFAAKTIGPAHLSISDRGLTFGTNDARGVCIEFREPVAGLDPKGLVHHPALTVTVADIEGLLAALQ